MDPEQTFLRVHTRLSGVLARVLTPEFRRMLEYSSLLHAVALLAILVVMHVNFVGQPACSAELAGPEVAQAHLVEIKITGIWTQIANHLLRDLPKRVAVGSEQKDLWKLVDNLSPDDTGQHEVIVETKDLLQAAQPHSKGLADDTTNQVEGAGLRAVAGRVGMGAGVGAGPGRGPLGMALMHYVRRCSTLAGTWLERAEKTVKTVLLGLVGESVPAGSSSDRSSTSYERVLRDARQTLEYLRNKIGDPVYIFSTEKGYLMLSDAARARHSVQTYNVSILSSNKCFGGRYIRLLIDNFVGYDTILMNSLLAAKRGGYLYSLQTKELYNLNFAKELKGTLDEVEEYFIFKFGVLLTSLFVFFTTTMSVSFTLRETQARMLKFTVQLQHHARHRLPTFRLIFTHVIESLVFVPIMIGILFFLFEFFDDQLLAFMVLTLVWLCELFTMISVRTRLSMQFFPRFFFLYFMIFHIYFFSYSYGFSYLAFFATAAFMQHSVLYFWNRYEVPALQGMRRRTITIVQQHSHYIPVHPPQTTPPQDPPPPPSEALGLSVASVGASPSNMPWLLGNSPGALVGFFPMLRDGASPRSQVRNPERTDPQGGIQVRDGHPSTHGMSRSQVEDVERRESDANPQLETGRSRVDIPAEVPEPVYGEHGSFEGLARGTQVVGQAARGVHAGLGGVVEHAEGEPSSGVVSDGMPSSGHRSLLRRRVTTSADEDQDTS